MFIPVFLCAFGGVYFRLFIMGVEITLNRVKFQHECRFEAGKS